MDLALVRLYSVRITQGRERGLKRDAKIQDMLCNRGLELLDTDLAGNEGTKEHFIVDTRRPQFLQAVDATLELGEEL